jgi:4-amino-4-deoxy-L-arabinose transferase-like glycosyltransferase
LARAVLAIAVVALLSACLDHLGVFPPISQDEPWIAAAPYKLATQGVYGSDLFAGYYGADKHNYQHMPLYPLLQAALFKAIGVGVFEMRLLPVLLAVALLLAVFVVASALADSRVGLCAAVLMLVLAIGEGRDETGILLLDRARINRYDIAVPVFGLLALWIFVRAEADGARWRYLVTGILTGLASLSHLFGAFWLPVFVALSAWRPSSGMPRGQGTGLIAGGFALTWLPWLAYIASGWSDFVGQMRFVSPRFEIFDPSFYVANALRGGGPLSLDWIARSIVDLEWIRPGAWATIVGVPTALAAILWHRRADRDRDHGMRVLALASIAQFVMFLTLLKVKSINYMIGLWPLAVILLAWLGVRLWQRRTSAGRLLIVAVVAAIGVEGATRIVRARTAMRHTMPYDAYTREIAACIPPGARVLGLQDYWLGLREYDYRTWLVPAIYANPIYHEPPVPFDVSLEQIDPDVVLIDRNMARFFDNASSSDHPMHGAYRGFERFMTGRHAQLLCEIPNATYGPMRVYRVSITTSR